MLMLPTFSRVKLIPEPYAQGRVVWRVHICPIHPRWGGSFSDAVHEVAS